MKIEHALDTRECYVPTVGKSVLDKQQWEKTQYAPAAVSVMTCMNHCVMVDRKKTQYAHASISVMTCMNYCVTVDKSARSRWRRSLVGSCPTRYPCTSSWLRKRLVHCTPSPTRHGSSCPPTVPRASRSSSTGQHPSLPHVAWAFYYVSKPSV